MKETRTELTKVTWPTKNEIIGSTIVTVVVSIVLSVFIGIVDDPWGNTRVGFYGRAKISRRDFGLMTDLMVETGGLLVGKDIVINIATELLLLV